MTDQPGFAFAPNVQKKRWTVTMTDGSTKTITATACRTDCGCVVFSEASGITVAMAAGTWASVEVQP